MASLGKWIKAKADADATLTSLIGSRLYPTWVPQNAVHPAVTYRVTYTPADVDKTQRPTNYKAFVQFFVWGEDYDVLEDIDFALQGLFDFGESITAGVTVTGGEWIESRDGQDERMEFLLRECSFKFRLYR
jgi:hypothetical protein